VLSYFSAAKGERNMKPAEAAAPDVKPAAPPRTAEREIVSTLGAGLLITGNIVSTGGVQVFGRVTGDIHAAHLVVGKGADVEGNVRAQDVIIDGNFKGTIHGNIVKLQSTATVEGEIYNRSLAIDQNAHFEGVARRLTQPVEAPSDDQIAVKSHTPALVPEQPVAQATVYGNGFGNGHTNGAAMMQNGQTSNY
jgi:cytoskeletal protein CcmA (bactofilin family)